jgi:hypothetical protein
MSTDNLISLKDDMVAFIEGHGLRRLPGRITDDIPSVMWEGKNNPEPSTWALPSSPSAR